MNNNNINNIKFLAQRSAHYTSFVGFVYALTEVEGMSSLWPLDGARILGPESEPHPLLLGGKGKETQALAQPEPQHRSREAIKSEPENSLRTSSQTALFYR